MGLNSFNYPGPRTQESMGAIRPQTPNQEQCPWTRSVLTRRNLLGQSDVDWREIAPSPGKFR